MNPEIPIELLQALANSADQEGYAPDRILVSSVDLAAVLRAADIPVNFKTGDKPPRFTFRVLFERDDQDDATPQGAFIGHMVNGEIVGETTYSKPYHDNSDQGARDQLLKELNEAVSKAGLQVSNIRYGWRVKGSALGNGSELYTHLVFLDAPFDTITALAEHLQEQGFDEAGISGRFQITGMYVPEFASLDLTIVR